MDEDRHREETASFHEVFLQALSMLLHVCVDFRKFEIKLPSSTWREKYLRKEVRRAFIRNGCSSNQILAI